MAKKEKVEMLTTEKTTILSSYFKGNELSNDKDYSESFREYGVKKLSAYSSQIEKLVADNPKITIEEHYTRNGENFEINAKSYSEFVRLSNMLVKSAEIQIERVYNDSKVIITHEKRVYNIDLF